MTKSMNGETVAYVALNDIYLTYVLSKAIQPGDYFILQFVINRTLLFRKLMEYITINQFLEGVYSSYEDEGLTMCRLITPPVPFKMAYLYRRLDYLEALGLLTIDCVSGRKMYGINLDQLSKDSQTYKNFRLKDSIQKRIQKKIALKKTKITQQIRVK